jgi:transketolase
LVESQSVGAGATSTTRQLLIIINHSRSTPHTIMSSFVPDNADDVAIATIRTLAVDVVGKANSGHPGNISSILTCLHHTNLVIVGAPMGMAPATHVLFSRYARGSSIFFAFSTDPPSRFLNANPKNSKWFNRDRFVLSNGLARLLYRY